MGSLVGLLVMMSLLATWLFAKFKPVTSNVKALKTVNLMIIGLALVMALGWVARVYATYDLSEPERVAVAQFAAFGGMGFYVLIVSIGFIIRNFLIFKPDRFYR